MLIERTSELSTLNRKVRQGMKKRDIDKAYPPERLGINLALLSFPFLPEPFRTLEKQSPEISRKAKALVDKLYKKGMYEADEDFPDDPEEYFYYVGQGGMVRKDDKKSEKMSLRIKDQAPDKDVAQALLEDGPLSSGAMPAMGMATEEGGKAVLEALHGEVQKVKPPKNKDKQKEETEPLAPKQAHE